MANNKNNTPSSMNTNVSNGVQEKLNELQKSISEAIEKFHTETGAFVVSIEMFMTMRDDFIQRSHLTHIDIRFPFQKI